MNMGRTRIVVTVVLACVVGLSACDFEVTNPGPVQDTNVNLLGAHRGLVNGGIRAFGTGLGALYVGEAITHGYMASGHTGNSGVEPEEEVALLTDERDGSNGGWNAVHRGRWIAEESIRRFTAEGSGIQNPGAYPLLAEAYLWAGFANRVLGENACTAVFDGGEAMPKLKYFERAIEHFNKAETVGKAAGLTDIVNAAIGARAAANLFLGNGALARTDAQKVPRAFKFTTQFSGRVQDEAYYVYGNIASLGFQSISFWGTPMHPHFLTTGDSRVAWGYDNGSREVPAGRPYAVRAQTHPARPTWVALVPMYYPLKAIAPRNAARELLFFEPILDAQRKLQVNLVTGREMELIIAEADLMEGAWPSAMTRINNVRTATPVYRANLATAMDLRLHPQEQADKVRANMPDYFTGTPGDFSAGGLMKPVVANSLEEAWAALKVERLLELSIEMRRFGDRWRWRERKTPGALHPLEYIPAQIATRQGAPTDPLNLCFPLTRAENDANSNVAADYKDWRP